MGNLNHEDIKMLATRLSGTLDLMEYVSIAVANEWTMERIIKSLRKERFKEKRVRSTVKLFLDTYENTTDKNRKAVVYRGILYCSVRKILRRCSRKSLYGLQDDKQRRSLLRMIKFEDIDIESLRQVIEPESTETVMNYTYIDKEFRVYSNKMVVVRRILRKGFIPEDIYMLDGKVEGMTFLIPKNRMRELIRVGIFR